jgi:general L-amino acid transport system substrate-binding protein
VDLETADRFTALQSGEIDVLVRNTTWTATRDGVEGATFLQPTFYDGQGMMVEAASGIESLEGLAGGVVCVAGGTTTEGNVATEFARLGSMPPRCSRSSRSTCSSRPSRRVAATAGRRIAAS